MLPNTPAPGVHTLPTLFEYGWAWPNLKRPWALSEVRHTSVEGLEV